MKRIILSVFACCLLSLQLFGQSVEARVVDKEGSPLAFAYVLKTNGSVHAHANEVGVFLCEKANLGDTLNISFMGFETKMLVLEEQHFNQQFDITLQEKSFDLGQVVVTKSVRSLNQVSNIDLAINPVNSSQEILRKVPGLFIGQHAGGGKAEQLFLRGFDIDHGTDVSISVDGMPVNMVSHAHGQGYADLHFLIPETIERLDFGKGPYYSEHGNFTTAGYVNFQTKEKMDNSQVGLEAGQFNTSRLHAIFDLLGKTDNHHAYLATEYLLTDGPFDSPQNFNRFNLMGKYTINLPNNDKLSILASHFTSKWDASGQIPQRAVDAGLISRFGAIDDTEGGQTSRTNFTFQHTKTISSGAFVKSQAFYSKYDFELFSNFTFFLEDPVNGDQIRQHEDRQIFGLQSVLHKQFGFDFADLNLQTGVGLRYDQVNENELARTLNRKTTLEQMALGTVNETNAYAFANLEFDFGQIVLNPGLRVDHFQFDYVDELVQEYRTLSQTKTFFSPKLNLVYNPNHHWQFYIKSGIGFHSNDTRVVVAQSGEDILPAAYGTDLGAIWKPQPRLWLNAALWYLFLEQEFVYVGDAGVVEPSGKTRRTGIDFGLRYQLSNVLFFDADVNYTYARSTEEEEGEDYIPLAPDLTAMSGVTMRLPIGLEGSIRGRFLKDRAANEDNTITAEGFFVTDVNLNYSFKDMTIGVVVENLFDTAWNEAQFATESRLQNETEPVEELHFTPGVPFFVRGRVAYRF